MLSARRPEWLQQTEEGRGVGGEAGEGAGQEWDGAQNTQDLPDHGKDFTLNEKL